MKKIIYVLGTLCICSLVVFFISGCSPNEVSESQILDSVNEYLCSVDSNITAISTEIVNYQLNEKNELIDCNIKFQDNNYENGAIFTIPHSLSFDYYDQGGWILSDMKITGYVECGTSFDEETIAQILCDENISWFTENTQLSISNYESGDCTYDLNMVDDGYDYGTLDGTFYFRPDFNANHYRIDYVIGGEKANIKWKNIDGTWIASWTGKYNEKKNIEITIIDGEITNISGNNSNTKKGAFSDYDIYNFDKYPVTEATFKLSGKISGVISASIYVNWHDSLNYDDDAYKIYFSFDGEAYLVDETALLDDIRVNLVKK